MIKNMNLLDLNYEQLKELVVKKGLPVYRADQITDMLLSYKDWDEASNLPKNISDSFKEYCTLPLTIIKEVEGEDGTIKFLYKLVDGNMIEGVYLPNNYGNTICVSTQVGCKMHCSFCASGKDGFLRDLTSGEILSQVLAVNKKMGGTAKQRAISNIVLMGSGEPLDNYDNVISFLKNISSKRGLGISLRNVTVSTCGLVKQINRLAKEGLNVTLTISLHATDDEKRQKIMPVAKSNKIADIINAADNYYKATNRRVSYEYALTKDNSDNTSIAKLIDLLKDKNVHVNLIRLNEIDGQEVMGISEKRSLEILEKLTSSKIQATLRRSLGSDIEGACGQLKNHFVTANMTLNRLMKLMH
ncbi:MAG TPA: 23S rRNA (adenine(2503)-C(2))-methyltransferase RlmN [Clostridia bacterium]|nr:23S rRNA (adenine(2503)-C(2))-methyltransferase RlmN [Clostridia bacterium]